MARTDNKGGGSAASLPYDPDDWERRLAEARAKREAVLQQRAGTGGQAAPPTSRWPVPWAQTSEAEGEVHPLTSERWRRPDPESQPGATAGPRSPERSEVAPPLPQQQAETRRAPKAIRAQPAATRQAAAPRRGGRLGVVLAFVVGLAIGVPIAVWEPVQARLEPWLQSAPWAEGQVQTQPGDDPAGPEGQRAPGDTALGGPAQGDAPPPGAATQETAAPQVRGAAEPAPAPGDVPAPDGLTAAPRTEDVAPGRLPSAPEPAGAPPPPPRADLPPSPETPQPGTPRPEVADTGAEELAEPSGDTDRPEAAPSPLDRSGTDNAVAEALAEEAPAAQPEPTTPLGARIFVHVPRSTSQAEMAAVTQGLDQAGFADWSVARVPFTISSTHIRYYHEQDAAVAQAMAEGIGAEARDFTTYSPSPLLGTIEVWLAGQAPTTPARTSTPTTSSGPRIAPTYTRPSPPQPVSPFSLPGNIDPNDVAEAVGEALSDIITNLPPNEAR